MSPKPKIKVAIYLRVSTDEQAKKFGIDTQMRKMKDFIKVYKDEGWVFDEELIYKDAGYSGSLGIEGRPGLKKLMMDAKKGKFDKVLVYRLDRFFRHMQKLLDAIEQLQELNIGFYSVSERFDTSPIGRLMLNIFGTLAQFERDLIIERTSEGKISAAKAGRYVGGAIPLGYEVVEIPGQKGKKAIAVNKDEAKLVRDIFYWFIDQDYTPLQIATVLSKRKVLTNKDKKYKGKYRKSNPMGKWTGTTIGSRLEDEHYIGKYYYNRRDGAGKLKPRDKWIELECPSIISNETFQKAQLRLKSIKHGPNNKKYNYLFSGKLACGKCHSKFTGYMSAKKTKNYRCLRNNSSKCVHPCKEPHISENILEQALWPKIEHFIQNPKQAIEALHKKLSKSSEYNFYKEQSKELKKQLEKLKQREEILLKYA